MGCCKGTRAGGAPLAFQSVGSPPAEGSKAVSTSARAFPRPKKLRTISQPWLSEEIHGTGQGPADQRQHWRRGFVSVAERTTAWGAGLTGLLCPDLLEPVPGRCLAISDKTASPPADGWRQSGEWRRTRGRGRDPQWSAGEAEIPIKVGQRNVGFTVQVPVPVKNARVL